MPETDTVQLSIFIIALHPCEQPVITVYTGCKLNFFTVFDKADSAAHIIFGVTLNAFIFQIICQLFNRIRRRTHYNFSAVYLCHILRAANDPEKCRERRKTVEGVEFCRRKTDDNSKTADTATGIAMIIIRFPILVIKWTPFNFQALLKHCIYYYLYNSILCFFVKPILYYFTVLC